MRISVSSTPSAGARDSKDGTGTEATATRRLRLLSYNIQAGIAANSYRHYLTHSWKHILPCPKRLDNLDRIARLLGGFDIVGLQEVDGGSLRSGFINQTEYLALSARFPYWHDQTNRNLGKFAQHSTGLLSRLCPARGNCSRSWLRTARACSRMKECPSSRSGSSSCCPATQS